MAFSWLNNNHSKAKRCYSYDRYVDEKLDLDVPNDYISVAEFKENNPIVVTAPCNDYPIVGSLVQTTYSICPNATKTFIKSLIVAVQETLKDEDCFASFNESNIVVTKSAEALFKHLESTPPTFRAKRSLYESLFSVINGLFGSRSIPEDIQHLLNLIKKQDRSKEKLYRIHPSLIFHEDKGWAFLRMYEIVKHRLRPMQKEMILAKLPYIDSWRTTRWLNDVLIEIYDFKSSSYEPYVPVGKTLTAFEQKVQSAEKLLDFTRNGISHRLERRIVVMPDQHETILLVHFPLLLPKLQESILEVVGEGEFDHLGLSKMR